jgi:hypothetical protein
MQLLEMLLTMVLLCTSLCPVVVLHEADTSRIYIMTTMENPSNDGRKLSEAGGCDCLQKVSPLTTPEPKADESCWE